MTPEHNRRGVIIWPPRKIVGGRHYMAPPRKIIGGRHGIIGGRHGIIGNIFADGQLFIVVVAVCLNVVRVLISVWHCVYD
jgi:hypothetical protein